jgi:hypothetical protein
MGKTTKDDVAIYAIKNHIWLNAVSCINPTKEYCEQLGRAVLEMLNNNDNLLPSYFEHGGYEDAEDMEVLQKLSELTPMLYLSINKS